MSSLKLGTIKVRPPSLLLSFSQSLSCTEQAEGTQKVGLNQDLDFAGKDGSRKKRYKEEVVMDRSSNWVTDT